MEKHWDKVLEIIKPQLSAPNFRTWFSKTTAKLPENGVLTINVPTTFAKHTILTKYLPLLESTVESAYEQKLSLSIAVDPSILSPQEELETPILQFNSHQPTNPFQGGLNPKYTLENFVVGFSNNLAYAAAQAVVQNPGTSYNPLFVYGGTGVGKTHLMHGIGHTLLKKNPGLKIIYCSSERFMNDFIVSIQTKKTNEFRNKYRLCDLLLIDDIQFISGRDSTQEEFFHTFNELQVKNIQIVLTSDRPPNEIQKLEPRLQSRFQGGLMVDIQLPDFDTRVAILKAKCQEKGEVIPESSLTLIAENMATNARELEGKLIQIIQTAKMKGQIIDDEYMRKFLGTPALSSQKVDQKRIISVVNQYFNMKMADLTGPGRKKELVLPRQMVMFLLYEECKLPYERIGEILGGRDHTTIMHGVEKIKKNSVRDREVQRMLIEIKQNL